MNHILKATLQTFLLAVLPLYFLKVNFEGTGIFPILIGATTVLIPSAISIHFLFKEIERLNKDLANAQDVSEASKEA